MAKRINDTELRKQLILQAAIKIFFQQGYYAATIDDIAKEAEVVKGTVLHYFGSKDKLLDAVLASMWLPFLHDWEELLRDENAAVPVRLEQSLEMCASQFVKEKSSLLQYADTCPDFRFLFDQFRLKTFYQMTDIFKAFLDEGCRKRIFQIDNTAARAEAVLFAIFGITALDLSPSELTKELHMITERLLSCTVKKDLEYYLL